MYYSINISNTVLPVFQQHVFTRDTVEQSVTVMWLFFDIELLKRIRGDGEHTILQSAEELLVYRTQVTQC